MHTTGTFPSFPFKAAGRPFGASTETQWKRLVSLVQRSEPLCGTAPATAYLVCQDGYNQVVHV